MTKRARFPSAKSLAEGPVVVKCAEVPDLAAAGLANHELLVEHIWYAPDDDDSESEDITLWPSWLFRIRRVGTKRWNPIGISEDSYSFKHCKGAGEALLRYFGALDEARGDRVADLTYED